MKPTKKELKNIINQRGFFAQMTYTVETNAPAEYQDKIPEGATYFEGIASNGELNRNGYIIRPRAWVDAIAGYMVNPIILLQHDVDQPIGQALSAEVREDGLHVKGYIFDDLTGGKFGRGLYKALSTGHYTLEYEFEHVTTGQVITEAEFVRLPFDEQMNDWVLAVTKLEWVEFSLVSIGSNRKSLVSKKNALLDYMSKNNLITTEKMDELKNMPEVSEEIEAKETLQPEGETPEGETQADLPEVEQPAEKEGETPETVVAGEQPGGEPENVASVPEEQLNSLKEGSKKLLQNFAEVTKEETTLEVNAETPEQKIARFLEVNLDCTQYLSNLADVALASQKKAEALQAQVDALTVKLDNTPVSKRLIYNTPDASITREKNDMPKSYLARRVLQA